MTSLSRDEETALTDLVEDVRQIPARSEIIGQGTRPDSVHLMLKGWAARSKFTKLGERQFTAFLIPGDFCDIHVTILAEMDHTILALSDCEVAFVSGAKLDRLTRESSNLSRALWWSTLVDEAVLREWVVNNGKRTAYEALAHVICEMHVRMDMIGLAPDTSFVLPITQEDLASATGLTTVHTNRVLQRLRQEGLIELSARRLTIRDLEGLRQAADFQKKYFHLSPRSWGDRTAA